MELRVWLRDAARVHERILERVLRMLEKIEVFEIDDLVLLAKTPALDTCLAQVTAMKVRVALHGWPAPGLPPAIVSL